MKIKIILLALITLSSQSRIILDELDELNNSESTDYVDVSYNKIIILEGDMLKKMINLTIFNAAFNRIEKIDSNFFFYTQLIKINLANNKKQVINKHIFSKQNKLIILNLSSNKITQIDMNAFKNLVSLDTLDLSVNMLTAIHNNTFASLDKLKVLRLNQNHIKNIDGLFLKTISVEIINLKQNKIKTFSSLENLKHLKYVDMSENQLEKSSNLVRSLCIVLDYSTREQLCNKLLPIRNDENKNEFLFLLGGQCLVFYVCFITFIT